LEGITKAIFFGYADVVVVKELKFGILSLLWRNSFMVNAFLTRAITQVRLYTDEPSINAKYTDATLIEMVEQVYTHVISEINRCSPQPIFAKYTVTYIDGTESYRLPELIGMVNAIYYATDSGYKIFYSSRSGYSPLGRQVWLEGKTLHIQSGVLNGDDVLTIEYISSGTARLHDGTCTVDSTGKLVTFGATPTDGTLDTHTNSYAGSIFRLLSSDSSSYSFIQERTIVAYNNITRVATLDAALSPIPLTGTTSYEIAPAINQGLDHAVASYLAYWLAAIEGNTTRANLLKGVFRDILRNLRLTSYYSNLQDCTKARADNFNNSRYVRSMGRGLP
jgi:hypothetical protein